MIWIAYMITSECSNRVEVIVGLESGTADFQPVKLEAKLTGYIVMFLPVVELLTFSS